MFASGAQPGYQDLWSKRRGVRRAWLIKIDGDYPLGRCLSWVNRVGLTMSELCPLFP